MLALWSAKQVCTQGLSMRMMFDTKTLKENLMRQGKEMSREFSRFQEKIWETWAHETLPSKFRSRRVTQSLYKTVQETKNQLEGDNLGRLSNIVNKLVEELQGISLDLDGDGELEEEEPVDLGDVMEGVRLVSCLRGTDIGHSHLFTSLD